MLKLPVSSCCQGDIMKKSSTPAISIVLPTFNRASFLPAAFEAIRNQVEEAWELIVIDDGGCDNSREQFELFAQTVTQECAYIYQANGGPFSARNTGIGEAIGEYVAFYDSDDLWLPSHLKNKKMVLDSYPEISWVFGPTRVVDLDTAEVLADNCFDTEGKRQPFLSEKYRVNDRIYYLLAKDVLRFSLAASMDCGFQTSLIRRKVFDRRLLPPFRVGEDQLFVLQCALDGLNFASVSDVDVVYRKHGEATCASSSKSLDSNIEARRTLIAALSDAMQHPEISMEQAEVLRRRISKEIAWGNGHSLAQAGRYREAIAEYKTAIKLWPYHWKFYKALFGCYVKEQLRQYR